MPAAPVLPASAATGETESYGEELANSLTHALGAALSAAGLAVLVLLAARHGDAWHVVSVAIFGATLVLLYTASALYHALPGTRTKAILQKCDHAAIFLLIAGTYTPFTLVSLRGPWGWSLFGVVWGLALAGVVTKFWFAGRARWLSTLLYVGLGWLVLLVIRPLAQAIGTVGFVFLLLGGLCYTGGVAFYLWRSLRYHHAVWHGWVLAGSACHFFAVLFGTVLRAG